MKLYETALLDDYPVFWDYLYVADGQVVRSDVRGNVTDLKRSLTEQGISCKEITSCDIIGRQELKERTK